MQFKVDVAVVAFKTGVNCVRIDVEIDGEHVAEKRIEFPANTGERREFVIQGGETTIREVDCKARDSGA